MIPFVIFLAMGTAVAMVAHLLRRSQRRLAFGPAGEPGGPLPSLVVAIGGAMFGGYLTTVTQMYTLTDVAPYVFAFLGSVILLGAYHLLADHHERSRDPNSTGRARRARGSRPFIQGPSH